MATARRLLLLLLLVLLPSASVANAAVYVVPSDDEMIDAADAIVIGTIQRMGTEFVVGGDIVTNVDLSLETVLKGHVEVDLTRPEIGGSAALRLVNPGGEVGSQFMFVSGAPRFWTGDRALLFLERAGASWRVWGMQLGKFDFVEHDGRRLAVRWAGERDVPAWTPQGQPHEERLRDADAFVAHILARVARSEDPRPNAPRLSAEPPASDAADEPSYFVTSRELTVETLASSYPPSAYTYGPFRWAAFDLGTSATFYQSGTQPGYDATGASQRALAAWTHEPGSNISYLYGGSRTLGFVQDGVNAIIFNSTTDVPAGHIAYAKWYGGSQHTYKGETFYSIIEGDVVVKSNLSVSQTVFEEAVTHELGHTLGFRHSDDGTPSSTAAVMKSVLSGKYGSSLGPWDVEAAQVVYTVSASSCTAPSITAQPASTTIPPGQSTTLSVTAVGTSLSYQWYVGSSGVTSSPISGATGPSLTVTPSSTTSYWVRVSNACGAAESATATVTVSSTSTSRRARWDFDGDGRSDIFWRNRSTGANSIWFGRGLTFDTVVAPSAPPPWEPRVVGDFNGDGKADILWLNPQTGETSIWLMDGASATVTVRSTTVPTAWVPMHSAVDFDGNGTSDIFWRNSSTGQNAIWFMSGTSTSSQVLTDPAPAAWSPYAAADADGDGKGDIFWYNTSTGQTSVWLMNGATVAVAASTTTVADTSWRPQGAADFDGNGTADAFWRNAATTQNAIWFMAGAVTSSQMLTDTAPAPWSPYAFGDFDGDGRGDVFWYHPSTGETSVWLMSGVTVRSAFRSITVADISWAPVTLR